MTSKIFKNVDALVIAFKLSTINPSSAVGNYSEHSEISSFAAWLSERNRSFTKSDHLNFILRNILMIIHTAIPIHPKKLCIDHHDFFIVKIEIKKEKKELVTQNFEKRKKAKCSL